MEPDEQPDEEMVFQDEELPDEPDPEEDE